MAEFLGLSEDELQIFLDETREHLETLETELLEVERGGIDSDRVARIFRAAHTIKGAAATVGLEGMTRLTHSMETLFDRMRSGEMVPTPPVMTALFSAVDVLQEMLTEVDAGAPPGEPPEELMDALHQGGLGAGRGDDAPGHPYMGSQQPSAQRAEQSPGAAGNYEGFPGPVLVHIRIHSDCPMPAVRALQVLLALERLGDVVGSDPSRDAIEAEQVSESLSVWVETDHQPAAITVALATIPDIADVHVEAAAEQEQEGHTSAPAVVSGGAPSGESAGSAVLSSAVSGVGGSRAHANSTPVNRNGSSPPVSLGGEDRTIRVDVGVLDDLINLVGELVIDRGRLSEIGQTLAQRAGAQHVAEDLVRLTAHLARVTSTLQETVLKASMLPIERIFKKFPRMVRDLAQQMGKHVDFQVVGEETELDRSLLEVIGDPLIHLLRNALDHGLEPAEERQRAGKPSTGTLRLVAAHEQNHVVILVEDDGRGIDPERVRASAVHKGVLGIERARELGDEDVIELLFDPGFSTAEQVTNVSGRGVGLDVVRRNIEQVGGRVEVKSRVGVGTTFRLLLPLTMATIRALLMQVGNETLALPLSGVAEVLRVPPHKVVSVKRRWVTQVRGRVVPLLWLQQFTSPGFRPERTDRPTLAVLVSHKGVLIGLVVDRLIGEQEVVVKGLGEFFGQVTGINGATILGDGNLALILDIDGLISLLAAENASAQASEAHVG